MALTNHQKFMLETGIKSLSEPHTNDRQRMRKIIEAEKTIIKVL